MKQSLSYVVITPARNEGNNLRRLAASMIEQTATPARWLVVDNGSTDDTPEVVQSLAAEHAWIKLVSVLGDAVPRRGAAVVRAFHAGLEHVWDLSADIVVKLDADVSFEADYFHAQLQAFAADPKLGISAGVCLEPNAQGEWEAARVTRGHVRGAVRAYRAACLRDVLPLEERIGWDGIDELQAQAKGWSTRTLPTLSFLHHRSLGARESKWHKWDRQGEMAHFMRYRPSYLLARTAYHVPTEPQAIAMLWSYIVARAQRKPTSAAADALEHLRGQQSLRALPARIGEKLGRSL